MDEHTDVTVVEGLETYCVSFASLGTRDDGGDDQIVTLVMVNRSGVASASLYTARARASSIPLRAGPSV